MEILETPSPSSDMTLTIEEHMELLLKLNEKGLVTWNGRYRSALMDTEISPRPVQQKTGLANSCTWGDPSLYKPLIDLYRVAADQTARIGA